MDRIKQVLNLLDSLDYDDNKEVIDEKCRNLIKDYIRDKKQEIGYDKRKSGGDSFNEFLDLEKLLKEKKYTKKFKGRNTFEKYYNSSS